MNTNDDDDDYDDMDQLGMFEWALGLVPKISNILSFDWDLMEWDLVKGIREYIWVV